MDCNYTFIRVASGHVIVACPRSVHHRRSASSCVVQFAGHYCCRLFLFAGSIWKHCLDHVVAATPYPLPLPAALSLDWRHHVATARSRQCSTINFWYISLSLIHKTRAQARQASGLEGPAPQFPENIWQKFQVVYMYSARPL